MEVAFNSFELRDVCEKQVCALRLLGVDCSERLTRRMADLREARNLSELLAGHPREIEGKIVLQLGRNETLTLCPNHPRAKGNQQIDWQKVSRVKVEEIKSIERSII